MRKLLRPRTTKIRFSAPKTTWPNKNSLLNCSETRSGEVHKFWSRSSKRHFREHQILIWPPPPPSHPLSASTASKSIQNPRSCGHGFFVQKTFWKPAPPAFSCSTLRTTLPGPFPESFSRFSKTLFFYLRSKMADLRQSDRLTIELDAIPK